MAITIRTTERYKHHPIWDNIVSEFNIAGIQGLIFQCTDGGLIEAKNTGTKDIPIYCLEALEYDTDGEFYPENFFTKNEWINKINTAAFFKSKLLLLTHKRHDHILFKLYNVVIEDNEVVLKQVDIFKDEAKFISWWKSIKKLSQTKRTVEAAPRQANTIFDGILEKYGAAWGGNVDGFFLSENRRSVVAILEVRQSNNFLVETYDPARYFLGTATRGGDFKTWLPLIYLKNAYKIPIILVTLSTKDTSKLGFAEVSSINNNCLLYVNGISPTRNVTDKFSFFKSWASELIDH
ncbi:hypothetical protein ACFLYV_02080 [Chloroflexota bacterium]